jgi:hypothetical protein
LCARRCGSRVRSRHAGLLHHGTGKRDHSNTWVNRVTCTPYIPRTMLPCYRGSL